MGGLGSLGPDALTRSQTFPWLPGFASLQVADFLKGGLQQLKSLFKHVRKETELYKEKHTLKEDAKMREVSLGDSFGGADENNLVSPQ